MTDAAWDTDTPVQAVVLPGGMPGTLHWESSPVVRGTVMHAVQSDALLCAICAAPSVLGKWELLRGRRATCYPGFEEYLIGAAVQEAAVVEDGRFIPARGAGAALDFGFAIVSRLADSDTAASLRVAMQCR